MLIKIVFHPMDDWSRENKDRVEGLILTMKEAATASWVFSNNHQRLSYRTDKNPADVIDAWESEGFEINEFVEFTFRAA